MKPLHLCAGLLLLTAACGREKELTLADLPPATRGPVASTVLQIPAAGGLARLYRVPSLEPSSWKTDDKLPPIAQAVGVDAEQGLVYVLDKKRNVVALDLETRRVRSYLENIKYAALGPDGSLYAVDTGSAVTQLVRRTPVRFRSKFQGTPAELRGTMGGTLLARLGNRSKALEVLGSDQPPKSFDLPSGPIATTLWGDLVAVAADTAVVIYETTGKSNRRSIPVSGNARAVLFSPSGHRIYVAREAKELLVFDRFGGEQLLEIELPGPAKQLRGDQFGQWLLVRPEEGDSAWVIDVGAGKYVGSAAVTWEDDLPAVVSPGTLLTRRGADLVALDVRAKGLPDTARLKGAGGDIWLPLAWHPMQDGETVLETDSAALASAADSLPPAATVYLQVSSSQNPTWATELSQRLQGAGLPASVLEPKRSDEAYRVVLGPYATREQAEETGRRIGMPSFIVTAQEAQPPRPGRPPS